MASFSRASSVHDMHNVSKTEERDPEANVGGAGGQNM